MLLYITGGVGFVLCLLALGLILILHAKNKSKLVPLILYVLGFALFIGSGFLHWKGFELKLPEWKLPWKEPVEDVQQEDQAEDGVGSSLDDGGEDNSDQQED